MRRIALLLCCGIVVTVLACPAPGGDADEPKVTNLDRLNTSADETDPFPAADGMTLLYASNKAGNWDILVSHRQALTQAWPAGKPHPDLSGKAADERSAILYKTTLYYAKNEVPDEKLADLKNFDLFQRPSMLAPVPLLGVSGRTDEMNPWVTPAGKEFYFSRKTDDGWVQRVARGPVPGPIGDAKPVGFPPDFHNATLGTGGLTMYLQGPLEGGRTGIFRSKRARPGAEWSQPEPITKLNARAGKQGNLAPRVTSDGLRLYFASDRSGGKGGLDLWTVLTSQLK
jgi:hypothetical protein